MAKQRKLKVFAAPIGFHDALVAAPSRAAALRAWGSAHDLFARGLAAEVTDPALTAEALAHPGEVIRRPRQDSQAPAEPPVAKDKRVPAHAAKPPKPSRKAVDEAEAALRTARARHKAEDDLAKERIEAAQRDRRMGQHRAEQEEERLAAEVAARRKAHGAALARWRAAE